MNRRGSRRTAVGFFVSIVQVKNIVAAAAAAAIVVVVVRILIVVIIKHLPSLRSHVVRDGIGDALHCLGGVLMDSIGIISTSDGSGNTDNNFARISPW